MKCRDKRLRILVLLMKAIPPSEEMREHLLDVGIIGRSADDLMQIGDLYNVRGQDWGLRGAALAAHRAFPQ